MTLAPIADWPGIVTDPSATVDLLAAISAPAAPATAGGCAAFVGTTAAQAARIWPTGGLVEVTVDGRPGWFPEALVDDLTPAIRRGAAGVVRLVALGDPLMKSSDRELLAADPAHRTVLWRALNNPGAVLVGIDLVGMWRPKQSGKRLTVTVSPFGPLTKKVRAAIDEEAQLVAAVRGATSVDVAYDAR